MLLAPLSQPLKVTRQALACRFRLWLQCLRLVQVARKEGDGAGTLLRITPWVFKYTLITGSGPAGNLAKVRSSAVIYGSPFAVRSLYGCHTLKRCAVDRVGEGKLPRVVYGHLPPLLGPQLAEFCGKAMLMLRPIPP